MLDAIQQFISGRYAPHGYCLLWQPELIWTHVISDLLIAGAYFSIPLALVRFAKDRKDVAFGWILWLFALFILACGTSHLMSVWNLWHGDYGVEAVVKAITAAASVPTAVLLWRLVPQALLMPSPLQLQLVNDQLRASITERDRALAQLQAEIAHRESAEASLVQAQKMDAVGQLTGGIAHDFNNLLQAVGGNLDLIKSRPGNTDQVVRWAENASKGVARGSKLTGQLLAFSRTQRLELRPLELNALIAGMRDLIASSIGAMIVCELNLADGDCHVRGDATQLELAVLNMAINARDAMPGGGTLSITTRTIDLDANEVVGLAPGSYIEMVIADTGTGMSAETLTRAMDPFFTTKPVGAGTGLGLSMAFGVASQSGGTLLLDSVEGEGTRVTFLLPCALPHAAAPQPSAIAQQAAPDQLKGMTIAIVDDDSDVRQFVSDCMTDHAAVCHVFDGGKAFLAARASLPLDLVLLDFAMPELNGADVVKQLADEGADLPVVVMTGYADSAALDKIESNVSVIRKPFGLGALLSAVLAARRTE